MRYQLVPFIIILASYGFYLLPGIIAKFKRSDTGDISKKVATTAILVLFLYANFIFQIIEKHKDIARRFQ